MSEIEPERSATSHLRGAQRVLWGLAHGVKETGPSDGISWAHLPASYFVYAYFLFDLLVNDSDQLDGLGITHDRGDKTKEKRDKLIVATVRVLGDHTITAFRSATRKRRNQLEARISPNTVPDWTDLPNNPPVTAGGSRPVTAKNISSFLTSIERLTVGGGGQPDSDLKEVHSFIYKVRNRIVHGSKTWEFIHRNDQAERFLLYTLILHATMDIVWEAVDRSVAA